MAISQIIIACLTLLGGCVRNSHAESTGPDWASMGKPQDHQPWLAGRPDTLERDVVIIGGGSSGTFTAVRLHQEGKSVALIEQENRLGGHVNTYVDPASGKTFDYGVVVLGNESAVVDYFQYLDTPLGVYHSFTQQDALVDMQRNISVPTEAAAASQGNFTQAILGYRDQLLARPYLASGIHPPSPVPEDLLIPFGDFLAKYNLSAIAYQAFYIDEGAGNILKQPALYMLKYFNLATANGLIDGVDFYNGNNDLQRLYDSALEKLGSGINVFLNSRAIKITRTHASVQVQVSTPSGEKTINAKKLVIAIPPLLQGLSGFLDLTDEEHTLFGQYNNSYIWNGIIRNTGIPSGTQVNNIDIFAAQGIPALPVTYAFAPTGIENTTVVWYGSIEPMSTAEVKAAMLADVARVQKTLGYSSSPNGTTPEIVAFNDHSPYELTVSVDAIRDGFYDKANALQGKVNTWWTGAAWETHSSSDIWTFTNKEVLPGLLASLG